MADAAWQRLLRYPAELPLVHVDHSHRAVLTSRPAQAPTGAIMGFDTLNKVLVLAEVYRDDGSASPDISFYDLDGDLTEDEYAVEIQKIRAQVTQSVLLAVDKGYTVKFVLVKHEAKWKTVAKVKDRVVEIETELLITYLKETAKTPDCRLYLTEGDDGPKRMPRL